MTISCARNDLLLNSSATGKAADNGAQSTVNGYMAFVLFSVAGLACTLPCLLLLPICAHIKLLVIRFCGSTSYLLVRLFAGE